MFVKWEKEIRRNLVGEIQKFFFNERNEELGEIAAEDFLEFIDDRIGHFYFNEGVNQALKLCETSVTRLEEDLFSLKRPEKNG